MDDLVNIASITAILQFETRLRYHFQNDSSVSQDLD